MPRTSAHAFTRAGRAALACVLSATSLLVAPLAYADPSNAPPQHVVATGETLWQIANSAGVDAATLAALNNLSDADLLTIGQSLKLPVRPTADASGPVAVPRAPSIPSSPVATGSVQAASQRSYTVADGDTLSAIASQFGTTTAALVDANKLSDPDHLALGTALVLPAVASGGVLTAAATVPSAQSGPSAQSAPKPAATAPASPASVASAAISTASSGSTAPSASAAPGPAPKPASQPAPSKPAPLVVVAIPAGSPTDGLAGAGLKLLGSAYVWGGSSPAGFDCSGFVWYVAHQLGKSVGRAMLDEYAAGSHPGRDELKVGDLVFFHDTFASGVSHNGIYIGNGKFVHAADEAVGVTISSLASTYWSNHWFGATRLS